jgi:hypothetical protein
MSPVRILRVAAINVVVFCVLAEALGLVLYYNETGRLFYTFRKTYEPIEARREGRLTGEGLHPYFGPTHRAGATFDIPETMVESPAPPRLTTNNFGFVALQDYPFVKTSPRQYVIGIFGGSVGVWFCQIGVSHLIEGLRRNAFFTDRELVPLCFSHEGYKQPQQLLVLSYFLSIGQQFDLVVNIDGFNEVALSSLNDHRGLDISMPSVMHLDPLANLINQSTLTPEKLQSLAAIGQYQERVNTLIARMERTHSAAINFLQQQLYASALNSYRLELVRFESLPSSQASDSLLLATPSLTQRGETALFDDIARAWAESSVLMNTLLTARGTPYFHVLQPNQYFTTRAFTPDEARVARSETSPFKNGAEKGYPVLIRAIAAGALKPVNFLSAVGAFDSERSAVYMDDCCHYTLRGNHLLASVIARQILGSNGPWNPASTPPAAR